MIWPSQNPLAPYHFGDTITAIRREVGKMDKRITIYHGSEKNIEQPDFGKGKNNNDFGPGFYCTANEELAKEWAVSSLNDGFSKRYTLDTEYLNILPLT